MIIQNNVNNTSYLHRTFTFNNNDAINFINIIKEKCDEINHHPEWNLSNNNLELVYFVKLIGFFLGFKTLRKLNSHGDVLRFRHKIYFSENRGFSEIRKSLSEYKGLFSKTLDPNLGNAYLISGLDMLNALQCTSNSNKAKQTNTKIISSLI